MFMLSEALRRYRGIALLIAGGLSATGFEPLNLWPVTLICVALLIHAIAQAERGGLAFLLGWLFGVGHFTIGNNWIATAFTFQANMPAWLGWLAVPLLALYLAVYPGLAAWGAWRIGRVTALTPAKAGVRGAFILTFAGCWIIAEWLRSWVFTGFAWNPFGMIALPLGMARPATWIGTYGLSGLVCCMAGSLLYLGHRGRIGQAAAVALLIIMGAIGYLNAASDDLTVALNRKAAVDGIQLTVVQPDISQVNKYDPGFGAINFARLAQNSRPLDTTPRLLLWPEAAISWRLEEGYPFRYYQFQPGESASGARAVLTRLLNPGDILLTGHDALEFDKDAQLIGARNRVSAIDDEGRLLGHYDKAHLVPYGEYLALRWLLEPLGASRLVPGTIDFWPGPGPRTLDLPFGGRRVKVGMQICYEIIFSGQVTDRANRPQFLLNQSNDAWFGAWGPPQHLAQARMRAIEEGLPVVRSTPTGISAVVDAEGRIVESIGMARAGRIDTRLPPARPATLFGRHGNILPLAFAALLIMLSLIPLARLRRSR